MIYLASPYSHPDPAVRAAPQRLHVNAFAEHALIAVPPAFPCGSGITASEGLEMGKTANFRPKQAKSSRKAHK